MSAAALLAAAAFALGCAAGDEAARSDDAGDESGRAEPVAAAPAEVIVTATDGALRAPDTIPAGWTTVRLVNQGDEIHMAQLMRIDDGRTLEDIIQYYSEPFATRGPRPAWLKLLGGPTAAGPRGTTSATQYLEPGSYAWGDFVDLGDGIPNVLQGMAHSFVVQPTGSTTAAQAAPEADVVIRLLDYAFSLSRPLAQGRQVIRVEHAGVEPHEIILTKLASGKTREDVLAWTQHPQDAPPFTAEGGGLGAMNAGAVAYFEVDLTPGEYVLLCLIPAPDGRLHVAHGMIQQFSIG